MKCSGMSVNLYFAVAEGSQNEAMLEEHFCSKMLACAGHLQSAGKGTSDPELMSVFTADQFGAQCLQGLSAPKVTNEVL